MMRLATNVLGTFVLDRNRLVRKKLFGDDVVSIARKLSETESSVCAEESEMLQWLEATGNKTVLVKNPKRFYGKGFKIGFQEDRERVDLFRICDEAGIDSANVGELVKKVNRLLTREKLKVVEKDQFLIQAVRSLDDIDEVSNQLVERLRDWYSLHFPELDHIVENHEAYARLVLEVGSRNRFLEGSLGLESGFEARIAESARDSLGVDFSQKDLEAVRRLSSDVLGLYKTKAETEEYITKMMAEVAPNISALAGPVLGARLISIAGGLKRLSIMPAGTIQVLGAEDAFFRFLKTGKKPPKHGIIFQLPEIRGSKKDQRGKIARSFAAKIALASRSDLFKGEFIGDRLRNQLDERIRSIIK